MIHASLGVICESPLLRKELSDFALTFGLSIEKNFAPESWAENAENDLSAIDCWLIGERFFEEEHIEAEAFLSETDKPVIYGLEEFSRDEELRRREFVQLLKKVLAHLTTESQISQGDIWVLGASLGGPEAVKGFLDALPSEMPVTFLYAQHLDEVGSKALADVIGRDSIIPVVQIDGISLLESGVVYQVPIDSSIDFANGVCFKTGQAWSGEYRPSIEELLKRVSYAYGAKANVVYFSGMGSDGADVAESMKLKGSSVWVQSLQSAVSTAMPESVISKGICEHIASPRDLAVLMRSIYCKPERLSV